MSPLRVGRIRCLERYGSLRNWPFRGAKPLLLTSSTVASITNDRSLGCEIAVGRDRSFGIIGYSRIRFTRRISGVTENTGHPTRSRVGREASVNPNLPLRLQFILPGRATVSELPPAANIALSSVGIDGV